MTQEPSKAKPTNLGKPYEPTPQERAAAKSYFARKEKSRPSPRMQVSIKGDIATISPDHPEGGNAIVLLKDHERDSSEAEGTGRLMGNPYRPIPCHGATLFLRGRNQE
jgi:hypothetical protein